jgi:predicted  nucleic acid-binding Zn-ribbon protein
MANCESCGLRFPYPGHPEKSPDAVKSEEEAATVPRTAVEKKPSGMAEESTQPKVTKQVTAADSSDRGLLGCPACGSTQYHRTKRTKLERLRSRQAVARCDKCGMRFRHPRRREKYPDALKLGEAGATVSHVEEEGRASRTAEESSPHALKLGEAVATVSHVEEEGRASRTAEESSPPKVEKQGTAADSSDRGLSRCPICGSTAYRRSRRTTLEHLLLRPKMARCRICRKRFPYPKR